MPIADSTRTRLAIDLNDQADTARLARRLARAARPGDVLALEGDLGMGKTAFARAFINTLAGRETEVPSPTFTLVQTYETASGTVWHFDLYRIADAEDAIELGIEEAFQDGISLIEWPDRLGGLLPARALRLVLTAGTDPDARHVDLEAGGDWIDRLRGPAAWTPRNDAIEAFLDRTDWREARRAPLTGDASFRRYERLHLDGQTAVLMDAPPPQEDVRPFIRIDEHLRGLGFSAPAILARDEAQGLLLLEDFGDGTFTRLVRDGADRAPLYAAAVDLLVELHRHAPPAGIARYDGDTLLEAPDLVVDWYVPAARGAPADEGTRASFRAAWTAVLPLAWTFPAVLALRDYFADNLMWLPERKGTARVGLLDFQDALAGPPAYDLVSLLQDARYDIPTALEQDMLGRYLAATGLDPETFRTAYAVIGAFRNARITGLWPRLWKRDGKPRYLQFRARTWAVLERNLEHPALAPVRAWFDREIPPETRLIPFPGEPKP